MAWPLRGRFPRCLCSGLAALVVLCCRSGAEVFVNVASGIGVDADGQSGTPCMNADGRHVAFAAGGQIYGYDTLTSNRVLISKDSSGNAANQGAYSPGMSPDGRWVVFVSKSTNLGADGT